MIAKNVENDLRSMIVQLQRAGDISRQNDVARLPLTATMATAGLDSVARVELAALIEERLGVWLDDDMVSDETTLEDIIAMILCTEAQT